MRDPLQPDVIRAELVTSGAPWVELEFHPTIGSTNDRARDIVRGAIGAPDTQDGGYAAHPAGPGCGLWSVVLTDHQVGGRGRLGRSWAVPERAAVAVSVTVPAGDVGRLGWVPLLTGLALARALDRVTAAAGRQVTPRLKWPNDVLLAEDHDRKVSGILCELVPDSAAGGPALVVGTGVNVDQSRGELPVETATSLALAGARVSRDDLVVGYLIELGAVLRHVVGASRAGGLIGGAGGAGARRKLRDDYRRRCSTIGSEVRVHLPEGGVVEGLATGVTDDGGLVVRSGSGSRTFAAGDVVHVRTPGGRLA